MNKKLFALIIISIIVITLLKFKALDADAPPFRDYGTSNKDDATWARNARNFVLFGEWYSWPTNYAPVFLEPIHTLMFLGMFKVFGISTLSTHAVALMCSILATILLFFAVKEHTKNKLLALLACFFFTTNIMVFIYSRTGLGELPLVLFMILTYFVIVKSFQNKNWLWALGPALALCGLTKLSSFTFILAVILYSFLYFREHKEILFTSYLITGLASIALWIIPAWNMLSRQLGLYFFTSGGGTLAGIHSGITGFLFSGVSNFIVSLNIHGFLSKFPEVVILAAIFLISPKKDWRAQDKFLIYWLIGGLFYVWFIGAQMRRLFIIIPALCILAALAFQKKFKLEFSARYVLITFFLSSVAAKFFIMKLNPVLNIFTVNTGNYNMDMIFFSLVAGAIITIVSIPVLFMEERSIDLKTHAAELIFLVASLSLILFYIQYGIYMHSTDNTFARASYTLGKILPPDSIITSREGCLLSLENKFQYEDCNAAISSRFVVDFISPIKEGSCSRLTDDMTLIVKWDTSQTDVNASNGELLPVMVGLWVRSDTQ